MIAAVFVSNFDFWDSCPIFPALSSLWGLSGEFQVSSCVVSFILNCTQILALHKRRSTSYVQKPLAQLRLGYLRCSKLSMLSFSLVLWRLQSSHCSILPQLTMTQCSLVGCSSYKYHQLSCADIVQITDDVYSSFIYDCHWKELLVISSCAAWMKSSFYLSDFSKSAFSSFIFSLWLTIQMFKSKGTIARCEV